MCIRFNKHIKHNNEIKCSNSILYHFPSPLLICDFPRYWAIELPNQIKWDTFVCNCELFLHNWVSSKVLSNRQHAVPHNYGHWSDWVNLWREKKIHPSPMNLVEKDMNRAWQKSYSIQSENVWGRLSQPREWSFPNHAQNIHSIHVLRCNISSYLWGI